MKYIVEFKDEPATVEDGMKFYRCKDIPWWQVSDNIISKLKPCEDNYQKGIDDAISTVKWLFANVPDKDLFEFYFVEDILNLYSYQEIKDRIEEYEKNKNEFHVGDEFVDDGKIKVGKGVIIGTYPDGSVDILWYDGSAGTCRGRISTKDFKKTGRNFKQIAEVLDLLNGKPQSPPEDMLDPCRDCKHYNVGDGEEPCESCKRHRGTEERWEPK